MGGLKRGRGRRGMGACTSATLVPSELPSAVPSSERPSSFTPIAPSAGHPSGACLPPVNGAAHSLPRPGLPFPGAVPSLAQPPPFSPQLRAGAVALLARFHQDGVGDALASFVGGEAEGTTAAELQAAVGELRQLLEGCASGHDWRIDGFRLGDVEQFLASLHVLDHMEGLQTAGAASRL